MTVDYSQLNPGETISSRQHVLGSSRISKYREAVGDGSRLSSEDEGRELTPPMAIAALSLRGVIEDLAIPGGTLHVGQELSFTGAVPVGETLICQATLTQNSTRGELRFIVVTLQVEDDQGRNVMKGKSTITLPTQVAPRT